MKNKMKNIKFYIKAISFPIILAVLLISGCETLEESPTSFIAPETFYKNVAQGEAGLTAAMGCLYQNWNGNNYGWAYQWFAHSDEYRGQNLNLSSSWGSGLWSTHYRSLSNVYMVLRSIYEGEMEGTEADINLLAAQAKFIRAFNYFFLVRMYGDVPLYTEEEASPSENLKARTPVTEVYEQIIEDLEYAIEYLPSSWPEAQQGRIDKWGAKGYLAEVYLTMATAPLNATENYAKAAQEARELLNDPDNPYFLHEDIWEVFNQANKYGMENMFSFNISVDDRHTSANIYGPGEIGGWSNELADVSMDTLWPEQERKQAYLLTWLTPGLGGWEGDSLHYTAWGNPYPAPRKYHFPYITIGEWKQYSTYSNLPLKRVAEIYLILAEAANMENGGPTQEAVDAINTIIRRANGGAVNPLYPELTTSMSMEEFDEAVIFERKLELCFEINHRYFDLIRKRMLDDVNPQYASEWDEKLWLFPIPEQDLILNPLLEQNPGWQVPASN